jgi:hypothetical protein
MISAFFFTFLSMGVDPASPAGWMMKFFPADVYKGTGIAKHLPPEIRVVAGWT